MKVFLPGVPAPVADQLAANLCRPEGSVVFSGTYPGLHDPNLPDGARFVPFW